MRDDADVLPLNHSQSIDVECVGFKAARLAVLFREGFPIPDGFVCTVNAARRFYRDNKLGSNSPAGAFESAALPFSVVSAIEGASRGPWAVRSSAVHEDSVGASFAGLYWTALDVDGSDALCSAVRRCWAAIASPALRAYRQDRQLGGEPQLALLIQRQMAARVAGAACSVDPLTGADAVVISAVRGAGAPLLAGACDGEEWVVREDTVCLRNRGVLAAAEAGAVATLVRAASARFGTPQHVEWAFEGERLYLLQTRPLTDLPPEIVWRAPLPGAWLRHIRLGEWLGAPVTPLMATWLLPALEHGSSQFRRRWTGLPMPQPASVQVNGWYFATVDYVPPHWGGVVRMITRMALHLIRHPRRGAIIFMGSLGNPATRLCLREWDDMHGPRQRRLLDEGEKQLPQLDPRQLRRLLDQLIEHAAKAFGLRSGICSAAWNAELLLAEHCRRHLPVENWDTTQRLLCGLATPADAAHAVFSLDWAEPTAGEMNRDRSTSSVLARTEACSADRRMAGERIRAALAGRPRAQRRFVRRLNRATELARHRSRCVQQATECWPLMRRALLRLGGMAVDAGQLDHAEDVFFLDRAELEAFIDGNTADMRGGVTERRRINRLQRRLTPPVQLGDLPASFRRALDIAETLRQPLPSAPGERLKGLPASPGRASGPVRVVREAAELARLMPGEVLVVPLLAPAWVPFAVHASAAVVDTGNHLAHACMLAREIGLPCVVGVGDATVQLRFGEWVCVDGGSGVVERVV